MPGRKEHDLIFRAAEEFERLVAVHAAWELPEQTSTAEETGRAEGFLFQFERGALAVVAVRDDDTITFSEQLPPMLAIRQDVSQQGQWKPMLGSYVVWIWTLTNQHGYPPDGMQIAFTKPDKGWWEVQLLCAASSLHVSNLVARGPAINQRS